MSPRARRPSDAARKRRPDRRSCFGVLLVLLLMLTGAGDAGGLTIAGRVLGPDGAPVPRVAVTLEPVPATYERLRLALDAEVGAPPVATTRTDAEGFFALAAPGVGMWIVATEAEGFLAMEHYLEPLLDDVDLPAVRLVRAEPLEVRVVDAGGEPLPALVTAYPGSLRAGWRPRPRPGRAGEDGRLRLPRGEGEALRLIALAPGRPVRLGDVENGSAVVLRIGAGAARAVRVVDGERRGVEGVVAYQTYSTPLAVSDADGVFRSLPVGDSRRPLRFLSADGRTAMARRVGVEVRLERPAVFEGVVIDRRNRDPIADALVWRERGADRRPRSLPARDSPRPVEPAVGCRAPGSPARPRRRRRPAGRRARLRRRRPVRDPGSREPIAGAEIATVAPRPAPGRARGAAERPGGRRARPAARGGRLLGRRRDPPSPRPAAPGGRFRIPDLIPRAGYARGRGRRAGGRRAPRVQ